MSRIFIDVGGYYGHSVWAALNPIFGFDRIYCFEPAAECSDVIRNIADSRVVTIQACLSNSNGATTLYNPGTLAASVFADAPEYRGRSKPVCVPKIDAAAFFKMIVCADDEVWMKLNCEGSECDILESLIDSGLTASIRSVLIDFDALKIPSQRDRVEVVHKKVVEVNLPHFVPEQVQYGMINNYGGIRNWLLVAGAGRRGFFCRLRSIIYEARIIFSHPEFSGYHKMRILKEAPFLAVFARSRRQHL